MIFFIVLILSDEGKQTIVHLGFGLTLKFSQSGKLETEPLHLGGEYSIPHGSPFGRQKLLMRIAETTTKRLLSPSDLPKKFPSVKTCLKGDFAYLISWGVGDLSILFLHSLNRREI